MNGYQPEKKCTNCLAFDVCNNKHKNKVCKNYKHIPPPPPPKSGSLVMSPNGITYTPPTKQRTVLSVRDFAILMNIANMYISKLENNVYFSYKSTEEEVKKRKDEHMVELQRDPLYQDLLRIRDKLGELNIEVETPSIEVEE